jgi:hypothetical protein
MLQIIVFCHAELVSASNLFDLETLKQVQGDNSGCFAIPCLGGPSGGQGFCHLEFKNHC